MEIMHTISITYKHRKRLTVTQKYEGQEMPFYSVAINILIRVWYFPDLLCSDSGALVRLS